MTLEERARAIADKRGRQPGSAQHRELEAFALRMLRECLNQETGQLKQSVDVLQAQVEYMRKDVEAAKSGVSFAGDA